MDLHVIFFGFFFGNYIVYFFAGMHNYTFYIFKSLSRMEILPVWALSSIWHEFYGFPMLFQWLTCLSHGRKQENISLEKIECISLFIPLFTVRTVLKIFIILKTYNFYYMVFKV